MIMVNCRLVVGKRGKQPTPLFSFYKHHGQLQYIRVSTVAQLVALWTTVGIVLTRSDTSLDVPEHAAVGIRSIKLPECYGMLRARHAVPPCHADTPSAQLAQQINIEDINAIAKDASEAIMAIYNDPSTWDVQHKQDNSPITKADIVANALICSRLKQLGA